MVTLTPATEMRLLTEASRQDDLKKSVEEYRALRNSTLFKEACDNVLRDVVSKISETAKLGIDKCTVPLYSANCSSEDAKYLGAIALETMKSLTLSEYTCVVADPKKYVDFRLGWPEAVFLEIGW